MSLEVKVEVLVIRPKLKVLVTVAIELAESGSSSYRCPRAESGGHVYSDSRPESRGPVYGGHRAS